MEKVDPVTLSVLNQAVGAVPNEMGRNLIRSAYSTIVREARDAATAVFTRDGEMVALGDTIPILLNAFPPIMETFRVSGVLGSLREGEALITNDAYAGSQHLDDVALVIPIFDGEGELLGFSGSLAHHVDIGAASPGINPRARELFQEGLVIPPSKIRLDEQFSENGLLASLISRNVRMPEQTLGDLRAQIAAVKTGERRILELAKKYGRDSLLRTMDGLLDHSERIMRSSIRDLPDGSYDGEEWVDDDGYDDRPLRVNVEIRVVGDELTVDLGGTDEQARGPVNAPLGSALSTIHAALKSILLPQNVTQNEGSNRPITVKVPEETLLNPRFPAPVSARMLPCFKLFDAMLWALYPVLEDRVIASSYSSIGAIALSRETGSGRSLYREALGGGYGAGAGYEGADGVAITLVNTANIPVEVAERAHPYFMVERYSLRNGSGGRGSFRGGMGVEKAFRVLEPGVTFAAYSDHHRLPPRGLAEGGDAERAQFLLERDGERRELPSKVIEELEVGDLIRVRTAGGGGFGRAAG